MVKRQLALEIQRSNSHKLIYDDIQDKLREIDEYIKKEYIDTHPKEERDWRTYEQQFSRRIKEAMASLDPLIHEAVSTIKIEPKWEAGRPEFGAEGEASLGKAARRRIEQDVCEHA